MRTWDPILSLLSRQASDSVSIHNMSFGISLTELCGFSFFSWIFKVDKNILFSFFEAHKDFWTEIHPDLLSLFLCSKMHTFSEQWVNLTLSGCPLFLSPAPHSKTLKTSALSSDQSCPRYLFTAGEAVLAHLAVVEIELSIQSSCPGHCVWEIPWKTDIWDLWRDVFTLPPVQPGCLQRVMFYSFMRIDVLFFPFSGISLDDSEE